MAMADALKFDVRVRERLLKKGSLSQAEVDEHLGALPDRAEDALEIGIKQPALQTEAEREVLVVRTLARPAQPVPPPRMFGDDDDVYVDEKVSREPDLEDEDDEDDEDEDEDGEAKAKAEAKPEDKAEAKPEDKPGLDGESAEKSEKKADVDDDWG